MSKKIILTRSIEDNQILAKQLISLGYSVIEFPAIKIVDDFNLDQKISFDAYDFIVFTSTKAIQAAKRYLELNQIIVPRSNPIAVVGETSAQIFKSLFRRKADLVASASDSQSLSKDLLGKLSKGQSVLFFTGNLSLDIIPETLKEQGINVDTFKVYKNIQPEVDLEILAEIVRENPQDLIFPFFSPSAVKNCVQMLADDWHLLNSAAIISIGRRTTAALASFQITPKLQLPSPNTQSLLHEIKKLI